MTASSRRSAALASTARTIVLAVTLAGCTAAEHADRGQQTPAPTGGTGSASTVTSTANGAVAPVASVPRDTVPAATRAPTRDSTPAATRAIAPGARLEKMPAAVRALYVNRFATRSWPRIHHYLGIADSTEINGLVLDMKDEFGLNYRTANPKFARNAGTAGTVRDLRALLDTIHAHGVVAIARIVVFKDSVTARVHPEWTIRQRDGSIWRDKKGIAWVNPYHRELWEYNIGVAEELVKLGFDEVQFDYIRFPEPYPSLPPQVFPESKGQSKADALAEYLKEARARIDTLGAHVTADIFGLVTTVGGPLEVGQYWEKISPNVDVVLPMVYPSHYPHGELGLARPNAEPYQVIRISIGRAHQRDQKLGITTPEHIRPWLQAFSLGQPPYGPEQLRAQKQATYDSGYDGWVLWEPGSRYDIFLPALERGELVSRKK